MHEAVERLADGVPSEWALLVHSKTLDPGSPIIVGKVSQRRLRVRARRWHRARNSWRPMLRGRLTVASEGCVLVGKIGWHPMTRLVTFAWLGGLAFLPVLATSSQTAGALNPLAFRALILGMLAFVIILSTLGSWMGRKDEEALLCWLSERLDQPPDNV
jgi:hypothetical protein